MTTRQAGVFEATILLVVGLVAGPIGVGAQQGRSDSRAPGIYEAVLTAIFKGSLPTRIVVQARPLPFRSPEPFDWSRFGADAEPLRAALASEENSAPVGRDILDLQRLPKGTALVSREEIEDFFRSMRAPQSLEERWTQLREKLGVQSYQGLSVPVVSGDGLTAVVWYSHSCGSLCGQGGWAVLKRAPTGADWTVVQQIVKVVS